MKVPKFTTPLTKFIRTGEGVIISIFGVVLVLVPIITNALPPALATSLNTGKWLALATVVSRSSLKAISLFSSQVPGMAPTGVLNAGTENAIGSDVTAAITELSSDMVAVKSALGITAGGIDPVSAAAIRVTSAQEAAVQPPVEVVVPESATKPDGPAT